MSKALSPSQKKAFDHLMQVMPLFDVVGITGVSGAGKTTLLHEMHERTGGAWICMRELLHALRAKHPLALEETFEEIVEGALDDSTHVYVDELSLFTNVVQRCGAYPRAQLFSAVLENLTARAETAGKKLIYSSLYAPHELSKKGYCGFIQPFTAEDYEFFCRAFLAVEQVERLDYRKVFRFARSLHAYDLKTIAVLVRGDGNLDTDRYIEALRTFGLTSNVNLGEVQQVSLRDLKGVDAVISSLEANVIVPLEQVELADELQLRPKRGVLLVGPPGTGKTTVGRALAHRLRSKFFLIDGTYIAGTGDFYYRI
jgi:transitional endoplasmic reticulum ATPase